jgi:membrane protein DedA with SNARE-associated domain
LPAFSVCLWAKFLFFDFLGAMLWLTSYMALGYFFSSEIERIAQRQCVGAPDEGRRRIFNVKN